MTKVDLVSLTRRSVLGRGVFHVVRAMRLLTQLLGAEWREDALFPETPQPDSDAHTTPGHG